MISNLDIQLIFEGDIEHVPTPIPFRQLSPIVAAVTAYGSSVCRVMEWTPRDALDLAIVANPSRGSTILHLLPVIGDVVTAGSPYLSVLSDAYRIAFGSKGIYEILKDAFSKNKELPDEKPVFEGLHGEAGQLSPELQQAIAYFAAGRREVISAHIDLVVALDQTTQRKISIRAFDEPAQPLMERPAEIHLTPQEQYHRLDLYGGRPDLVDFSNPRGHYLARFDGENYNALKVTLTTGEEAIVLYPGPRKPATNRLQRIRAVELVHPLSTPSWGEDVQAVFMARPEDAAT